MSAVPGPLPPFDPAPGSIPTLDVPDPSGWRRLHLVGAGGAGMRGLAQVLLARGVAVSGSDLKDSPGLDGLRAAGATIFVGHRAEQVDAPDAIVISSAVSPRNPEVRAAREADIPILMRAQVLAALMRDRRGVAIAGTHGKTTTTSMVAVMLSRLGLDPTFVVGGDMNESGSGASAGNGDLFVAEADESDGSFLLLRPTVAVVTNVEADHLELRVEVLPSSPSELEARVEIEGTGRTLHLRLSVPPRHNLLNAAAALGVAHALRLPLDEAAAAIGTYGGVHRRFERKGEAGGAHFVDDYAIHPTEIASVVGAARAEGGRVVAVFQPHRYSRTSAMWRELGESLAGADVVVITDVYAAWEEPIPGVTGKLVVDALAEAAPGKRIVYLPRRADVGPFLASFAHDGDRVVTLGAGDITMVADETLELLRERAG